MTTTQIEQRTATSTRWDVDRAATSVDFAVKTFWGLMTVRGRFNRFDGSYEVAPVGTKIELTVEADSLDTGNTTRDKHLRGDDFFHVGEHPRLRFTSTRVRDLGYGKVEIEGDLEAAGKSEPLAFDATVTPTPAGLQIEGTTTVDQRRLGMSTGRVGMIRPPATLHVKALLKSDADGGHYHD